MSVKTRPHDAMLYTCDNLMIAVKTEAFPIDILSRVTSIAQIPSTLLQFLGSGFSQKRFANALIETFKATFSSGSVSVLRSIYTTSVSCGQFEHLRF